MKFTYSYKTSDGVRHEGELRAGSKNEVYAILKKDGIRPFSVSPASGLLNRIQGVGKRWLAIVVLIGIVCGLIVKWVQTSIESREGEQYEFRAQIYGDPAVLRRCENAGWTNVFVDAFDVYLARYAVPGQPVVRQSLPRFADENLDPLTPDVSDYAEVAKMKRIVNGMKRECKKYLDDGGNISGYLDRLEIRQNAEIAIYQKVRRELLASDDYSLWRKHNAMLRGMGLPMISEEEKIEGRREGEKK